MNIPEDLRFTKEHEWVRIEGDIATVGISEYAQGELGDIVFVELPQAGDAATQFERVLAGDLEFHRLFSERTEIGVPVDHFVAVGE